jgi:PhnB protein
MPSKYRPEGFHDVNLYLVVKVGEADALIRFLKQAFAATVREEMRDPSGRLAHGEFTVGDSVVEIGENGEWQSRSSLHFFVPDVDAVHAKALAAGAKELGSPVDHEYGERSSAVEDPSGNRWYIAKALDGRS